MRYIPNSYPPPNNYYQQGQGAVSNGAAPYYFGGYGYNNQNYGYNPYQYYGGGYYYNYYNELAERRRREQEEIQRRELFKQQQKIWERCVRINCNYLGIEYDQNECIYTAEYEVEEEYVPNMHIQIGSDIRKPNKRNNQQVVSEPKTENYYDYMIRLNKENQFHSHLERLLQTQQYSKQRQIEQLQQEEEYRQNYKYTKKDETLFEYFRGTGRERYIQFMEEEARAKNRNLGRLYDSPGYTQLLGIHDNKQTITPDFNIDDIEITLPEHLKNSYTERKKQFMDAIINSNPNLTARL